MKLSRLLSLATTVVGTGAGLKVLQRRHRWEQGNRRVAICVDYDDVQTAAIRAGISFVDLATRLFENGATHLSLPEVTIGRLIEQGVLTPQAPSRPYTSRPTIGHWNYLHGSAEIVEKMAEAINYRLPHFEARVLNKTTLAFGGSIPALSPLPLSFDEDHAREIKAIGLDVVPRPISYDWPEPGLIDHTMHSAGHVADLCCFDGDWVLGHEMQLGDTLNGMSSYGLGMVYFAETRHQRGDWFIAKGRLPNVVLAHRFTRDEMMGMDYHSASHQWVHYADERGVRFCYINFFRVLHATDPLEGVHYVHHLKHALEDAGYTVTNDVLINDAAAERGQGTTLELNSAELALTGLAAAGIGAMAINETLKLPEQLAVPLIALASAGAAALPYVENSGKLAPKPHSHSDHGHEHEAPQPQMNGAVEHVHAHGGADHAHSHAEANSGGVSTSFAPKLIALSAAALAPIAALSLSREEGFGEWLLAQGMSEAGAVALAVATTGAPYQLAVEEYRGFGLDQLMPLAAVALSSTSNKVRVAALAGAGTLWFLGQRNGDLLLKIDAPPAEGHVHDISLANRLFGGLAIKFGPRPARKWAGVAPFALAFANGNGGIGDVAALIGTGGNLLGLVGFRSPERAIEKTFKSTLTSWGAGVAAGAAARLM